MSARVALVAAGIAALSPSAGCASSAPELAWVAPALPRDTCRVEVQQFALDSDQGGATTALVHDRAGRLIARTGSGGLCQDDDYLEYDSSGRLTRILGRRECEAHEGDCDVIGGCPEPARRSLLRRDLAYDESGRPSVETRVSQTFIESAGRFRAGRPTRQRIRHTYDSAGQLRPLRNARATLQRDADGRIVRADSGRHYWTYEYTGSGALSRARLLSPASRPAGGLHITWTYDAHGRVSERTETRTMGQLRYGTRFRYRYHGPCGEVDVGERPPAQRDVHGTCLSTPLEMLDGCRWRL